MRAIFESRDIANSATEKLKVYAQPQRLMILSYLLRGEKTVSEIAAATEIGQPALSQQLASLRRSNVVKARRAGKQIWYDLEDDAVRLCIKTMEAILGEESDPCDALTLALTKTHSDDIIVPLYGAAEFVKIL